MEKITPLTFRDLGLIEPIIKTVNSKGYTKPTPIQSRAIPFILENRDVIAIAQTGTGKTAAFTLPLIQKLSRGSMVMGNSIKSLILVPTRELAIQVSESIKLYGKNLNVTSTVVYGGVKINPQMLKLRRGYDILVATPGRLLDLYDKNCIKFNQLEVLVLDEADRMLSLGFKDEIERILSLLPKKRQNLLFSATFQDEIKNLALNVTNSPIEIEIEPKNRTAQGVEHYLIPVDKSRKPDLLLKLYNENRINKAIVFVKTQHRAKRLAHYLEKRDIKVSEIHGGKSQGARKTALKEFKDGNTKFLIATDIIARGLDIESLPWVINFDLPHVAENYVHRIGRTGRKGESGCAISLVSAEEFEDLIKIERQIQKFIPRENVSSFEPKEPLPDSPKIKPLKPKRPKKKKKKLPQ